MVSSEAYRGAPPIFFFLFFFMSAAYLEFWCFGGDKIHQVRLWNYPYARTTCSRLGPAALKHGLLVSSVIEPEVYIIIRYPASDFLQIEQLWRNVKI